MVSIDPVADFHLFSDGPRKDDGVLSEDKPDEAAAVEARFRLVATEPVSHAAERECRADQRRNRSGGSHTRHCGRAWRSGKRLRDTATCERWCAADQSQAEQHPDGACQG